MTKVLPDFLRNSTEIVEYCIANPDKFRSRKDMGGHRGPIPVDSKFKSFVNDDMDDFFVDLVFKDSDFDKDLKDFYYFLQIQKYEPGDYIVPHRDNYDVQTLHLVSLTTSEVDGLIVKDGNQLIKLYDTAGQKIITDFNDFHWVDPVKDLRFSLVIGE